MFDNSAEQLHHDATYVIAGGLGGLGRSAARWMAANGAKILILLSRSGPKKGLAQQLLDDLRALDVRVETPLCDITCRKTIQLTLANCLKTMPPIRGCIQGTMVLQVRKPSPAHLKR